MEAKLQELTESIYKEGILKAQNEARDILAQAQEEAKQILEKARSEAGQLEKSTLENIKKIEKSAESELQKAGQQALAFFRTELANSLETATIKPWLAKGLNDKNLVRDILIQLVSKWTSLEESIALEVHFAADTEKELATWYAANLAELVEKGLHITFDGRFKQGFKIGPADGTYLVTFTDADLTALFQTYLKTNTKNLLFPDS